jgi:hypothetical protein
MTKEKFESIVSKQISDEEKRKSADFVIHTDIGIGFSAARAQLASAIEKIIDSNADRFTEWKTRAPASPTSGSKFDAVAFDLDDTLVPTYPPVLAAYEDKYSYMATNMPKSLPEVKENFRVLMQS